MKHTITAEERENGFVECPTFSGLKNRHNFEGVLLEHASGDIDFFETNLKGGKLHIHATVKNRIDGLTRVWKEVNDEIIVSYDSINNIVKIKELVPDVSDEKLAENAVKIREIIERGKVC